MDIHPLPCLFEPVSAVTHLGGALIFAVFGVRLLLRARGNRARVAFFAVYVLSGVFLLSMSGVYHMLPEGSRGRDVLGRLDYAGIFVLIAGTHTPVQGLFFRGAARWAPLALIWTAALSGIVLFSVFYNDMPRGLGTAVFLTLGWMAAASGLVLWRRVGTSELRLLLGGGVAYSLGAVLMSADWPTLVPGVFGAHEFWHLAVLSAMAMHWSFLARYAQAPTSGPPLRRIPLG